MRLVTISVRQKLTKKLQTYSLTEFFSWINSFPIITAEVRQWWQNWYNWCVQRTESIC